jgi:hypothetical protein
MYEVSVLISVLQNNSRLKLRPQELNCNGSKSCKRAQCSDEELKQAVEAARIVLQL